MSGALSVLLVTTPASNLGTLAELYSMLRKVAFVDKLLRINRLGAVLFLDRRPRATRRRLSQRVATETGEHRGLRLFRIQQLCVDCTSANPSSSNSEWEPDIATLIRQHALCCLFPAALLLAFAELFVPVVDDSDLGSHRRLLSETRHHRVIRMCYLRLL